MQPILTIDQLEAELSRPTQGALEALRKNEGDVIVLGAGGKIGPTLCRMIRRGLDEIGQNTRRVFAVSRFTASAAIEALHACGVEAISCDLLDRMAVLQLPLVPNVFYLAGQKFGTSDAPERTWAMNTIVPVYVAEHYASSRIVAFSTGCVYPLFPAQGRGAREDDALGPPGDYANSCVGRERVFEHFSKRNGTRIMLFRLCYAIDLRYGVLCDIATKVLHGMPVDVSMGAAHVIWQGDANARAIQCLDLTTSPPTALNITGIDRISIREMAEWFATLFGRKAIFVGQESDKAWIWDANRSYELFGPPEVALESMVQATAYWLKQGGATLGKPTHFEVADGQY
jgi:nucleoside-diphosphate-sugar epimerase